MSIRKRGKPVQRWGLTSFGWTLTCVMIGFWVLLGFAIGLGLHFFLR